jgi:hypothetical protein
LGFGEKLVQRLGEYGKLGKSFREAVGESFCRAERLSFSVSEWIAFGLSQPIGIAQLVRLTQPIGKPFDIGQRFAQSLGKPFRVAESFSVSERIAVSLAQRVAFGIGQPLGIGERLRQRLHAAAQRKCQCRTIGQQPKSSLVIIDRLGFIQCRVGIIRRIAIEFRPAVLHTGR